MKYRCNVGINWKPTPSSAEERAEAGEVVDLPPKIADALGDAVERVRKPKEDE